MLRGLIVRQVFFIVDLLFMGIIGVAAIFALKTFLEGVPETSRPNHDIAAAADTPNLEALQPRGNYDSIVNNKLFGDAGNRSSDAPVVEEEPEGGIIPPPATLPLKLMGTIAVEPTDPRSSAIIANARARDQKNRVSTYFVGQVILDQISLLEVHKRSVRLRNAATRETYELLMDDGETKGRQMPAAVARQQQEVAAATPPGVYNLNRDELVQDVMDASTELAAMNPRIAYDDDGNPIGITADGLDDLELAQKLGFEEGDVVQQINGRAVDSMDKVYETLQQFQGLNTVRISVMRNGRPTMLTYNLQ
jgi:type II secretory pathway component PulC